MSIPTKIAPSSRVTPERVMVVEASGARIEVRGMLAKVVAYLVTAPGLATDLDAMANGSLEINWGVSGPMSGKVQKWYPRVSSSSLMGESS